MANPAEYLRSGLLTIDVLNDINADALMALANKERNVPPPSTNEIPKKSAISSI